MSSSRARYRTTTPGSSTRKAGSRQSPISASSRSRADSCSREQITFLVTARCATRPYRITVLTTDEVRAIPLFSALESKDLEHLARTSEDIHLRGGEWAVHEGGERALFAVLAGKIEVIKLIDGIETRLGWRVPGHIFGERAPPPWHPLSRGLSGFGAIARHARGRSAVLRHCRRITGSLDEGGRAGSRAHGRASGH